jgi:hypothetical protein
VARTWVVVMVIQTNNINNYVDKYGAKYGGNGSGNKRCRNTVL